MNSTSRPPHRYLFALIDGGGTVPAELGVVRRVVDRGHHVLVLAEDSMRAEVEASGAEFRSWVTAPNRATRLEHDDRTRDWECRTPGQLFGRLLDRQLVGPAAAYAADVSAAIDEQHPDLVVCSMFLLGAMVAAEAAGVPFDVVFPNTYLLPTPGMPPFGMGLRPATGRLGRTRDRALHWYVERLWDRGVERLDAVRATYGLGPLDHLLDQMRRARRHLVLTSPDFDFAGELAPNVRYAGAILEDPAWADEAAWTPPPGDDPLVLVALSSSFQDQLSCLQRIVDGLGTLAVRGIVTTGPALDPTAVVAPPNVTVLAAAPHSQVLRETAVIVTHGGHGTVVRSLAAGVPMVVMHHGRDQADNAVRVTSRGAGVSLSRKSSPAKIAAAVRTVLDDPSFRTGAATLGASIRGDAADGRLLAELEDLQLSCQVPQNV